MKKYSIGVDFGSLSARAVIYNVSNGDCIHSVETLYEHAIYETVHPYTNEPLPVASSLQLPEDFSQALGRSVKTVIQESGIQPEEVVGISVDCTSCSLIPVDNNYRPLCWSEAFKASRHSYVKMWKQHTAVKEAEEISRKAGSEGERFGGKILSEWGIPKILETLRHDPELYQATYRFLEVGDWLIYLLTGQESMSYCSAGYKFMWRPGVGYPSRDFFASLDEGMRDLEDKLVPNDRVLPLDSCAGYLTKDGAILTGLPVGTPVAPMRIDGHSAAVAVGCHVPNKMVMIVGTSMGMLLQHAEEHTFPGLCGVCYGAMVPQYYGYETGLSACGDIFAWFAENCVPAEYERAANENGLSVLAYLTEKMKAIRPGESGLIALDWWNGNRSILEDEDLSGCIFGLTLQTRPEEICRALFEATGFSAKTIIEEYRKYGINVDEIVAVGGIAEKNPVLIQIYADIIGCDVLVPEVHHACALGTAIYAAVAAGKSGGGYDTLEEAVAAMASKKAKRYVPTENNIKLYQQLYEEYQVLHDHFGRGNNNVLKRLLDVKKSVRNND